MITLTPGGTRAVRDAEWNKRQAAFDQHHCVVLEDFVHPSVLAQVRPRLDTRHFGERVHHYENGGKLATELLLHHEDPLNRLFDFLLNQKALFAAIAEFARCDADIQSFAGRGFKMFPGVHFDSWHNDFVDYQRVGLSINLQSEPVSGGEFQIRHTWSGTAYTFPTPRFGDALLFRIGLLLAHRVLPIKGTVPRFCYGGWFETTPRRFLQPLHRQEELPPLRPPLELGH